MRILLLLITLCSVGFTHAQFTITPKSAADAAAVVTTDLIPPSITPLISNATFTGTTGGYGTFVNGNFGIASGVVLSTGLVANIAAPPAQQNDHSHFVNGDTDLQNIPGAGTITDVAKLEFDMYTRTDTVHFRVVFASEEYPEFVCGQFSDVFGIFVTGPNPSGLPYTSTNFAVVPGTSLPINVNSVNPGVPGGSSGGTCSSAWQSLAWSSHYVDNVGSTIIFDGYTTVLDIKIPVVLCANYHFKIAIGDAVDGIYDSGVFIECIDDGVIPFTLQASSSGSITSGDSTYLCQGDTLTLTSPAGIQYFWSNFESTQSIAVATPGQYSLSVSDPDLNCFAFSTPHTVVADTTCSVVAGGQGKPQYEIITHRGGSYLGTINIELFPTIAPKHVANFDSLVAIDFLDSTAFHRVVPGFVIQGGDPNSINGPVSTWGMGQPWQQTVDAEFSVVQHLRGRLGAARDTDTNSASSQFYICVANALSLDGDYTVYGQVTSGLNIVDTIVSSPRDVNDVPLQKIEMFVNFTGYSDTIPDAPVLTVPADSATDILNGTLFQWSAVSDAVMYRLEVSTDTSFSSIQTQRLAGTNSITMLGVNPSTTYYWRVKTDNGGNESAWSDYRSFTTKGTAQLIYPANNDVNIPINPTFQWTAVSNVASYNLQIDYDSNFVAPYFASLNGITQTQRQVNNLPANTTLWWRVRYISGGIQGFFSEKYTFTTGTSVGIEENNVEGLYIKNIYPVPAEDHVIVEFNASKPVASTLTIKSIAGQTVLTDFILLSPGESGRMIDTKHFAGGIYFLTIHSGEWEETRMIEIK